MKKFDVTALTRNDVKINMTVEAETSEDAELAAGRRLIERGFSPKSVKISSVTEH